jgi:hypothetical protein
MQAPQVQARGTAARVLPLSIACNNLKRYATVALRRSHSRLYVLGPAEGFHPALNGRLDLLERNYVSKNNILAACLRAVLQGTCIH